MLRGREANVSRVREQYRTEVGREWPNDDAYLRELTKEASSRDELRNLMLETDPQPTKH